MENQNWVGEDWFFILVFRGSESGLESGDALPFLDGGIG